MIADNRLTEVAVWDDRLLAEQLKEFASVDLDFDIEATGFDLGEIDFRIESLLAPASEPGRLWTHRQLGRRSLALGRA